MQPKKITFSLLSIVAVAVLGLLFWGPIEQNSSYHHFADEYDLIGIPNALNVISNLPFVFIGILGLIRLSQRPKHEHQVIKLMTGWMFLGFLLTGFGSAYYHWSPDNASLIWDRLPMTMVFMSLFALILARLYDHRYLLPTFIVLAIIGILSVLVWSWTGDLRLYALVQFVPILSIPFLLLAYQGRWPHGKYIWIALVWYIGAKVFEHFDQEVMEILGLISGHTIKHILAFLAMANLYNYARTRLNPNPPSMLHEDV